MRTACGFAHWHSLTHQVGDLQKHLLQRLLAVAELLQLLLDERVRGLGTGCPLAERLGPLVHLNLKFLQKLQLLDQLNEVLLRVVEAMGVAVNKQGVRLTAL